MDVFFSFLDPRLVENHHTFFMRPHLFTTQKFILISLSESSALSNRGRSDSVGGERGEEGKTRRSEPSF